MEQKLLYDKYHILEGCLLNQSCMSLTEVLFVLVKFALEATLLRFPFYQLKSSSSFIDIETTGSH